MLAERLSVSLVTIKRDISKLTELGIIRHVGSSKTGRWEIIAKE
jgi:DeoR/GlpR family transcriptional regulator of sugar metabolism